MYQHHYTGTYKFLLKNYHLSYVVNYSIKYLLSHMYDTNYSHCKHMFLCYIMLWLHFLSIYSWGRRKRRWNRWIAEQNPGSIEAGALYGGENTCQVNQNIFLPGKPHFMDFGINVLFKPSLIVLWRAVSVFSITLYACKCIWKQKYLTSTSLKFIETLKNIRLYKYIAVIYMQTKKTLIHDIVTILFH